MTTAAIRAAVEERFRLNRHLEAAPIHVVVEGDTVVLLGVVPGEFERSTAGRYASDTRGVARTDNQLSIIEVGTPVDLQRTERSDADLERDAVRSLRLSRRLGDEPIRVAIRRGVARLGGLVESDGDRIFAGEIVAGVPGIRGVRNGLVVQPLSPPAR